jgi:hypothetical protein
MTTPWLVYRTEPDAVVILEVFGKKTRTTPRGAAGD